VRFGGISGLFGLAIGILARLRLSKIRTMARPDSPDMSPKRAKKEPLGINIINYIMNSEPYIIFYIYSFIYFQYFIPIIECVFLSFSLIYV